MNMNQYPMQFRSHTHATSGILSPWTSTASNQSQPVGLAIPPEFQGSGQGYSPEDLYAMALQNCFVATFKVFSEKSKLAFTTIDVEAILHVDRNTEGKPWMARIEMKIKLSGVQQKEIAQRILERTKSSCMILNSVNTEKSFEFIID